MEVEISVNGKNWIKVDNDSIYLMFAKYVRPCDDLALAEFVAEKHELILVKR